jgi:hypothetical protein
MLSSDRLKAFASLDLASEENDNWDHNYEGDLITIKPPRKSIENDAHELETIRPYKVKPTIITQDIRPPIAKSSPRKTSRSDPPKPKSSVKAQVQTQAEGKFVLPSRPAFMYRELSIEDYSDLHIDSDSVFDRRLNINKVLIQGITASSLAYSNYRTMLFHQNSFIHQISQAYHVQLSHHSLILMEA